MVKRITAIVNKQGVSNVCALFFSMFKKGVRTFETPCRCSYETTTVCIHSQYATHAVMLYPIFPSTICNAKGFVTFCFVFILCPKCKGSLTIFPAFKEARLTYLRCLLMLTKSDCLWDEIGTTYHLLKTIQVLNNR